MSEDCSAVGFSGEGRCIEPAVVGSLCATHATIEACDCDCHQNPTRGCWCTCAESAS